MLIGQDFDKIQFELFGLELLEPNAFIGDSILGLLALFLAFRIRKIRKTHSFYSFWFLFFISFGLGFIMGGLGHLFWNYWGVAGKYFAWFAGLFSSLFAEHAMIAINKDRRERHVFRTISRLKFVYAFLILTFLVVTRDLTNHLGWGLAVSLVSTGIGTVFAFGVLPYYYKRTLKMKFHYFWAALFMLLPVAFVQNMKINIAPWMDRNDISHILMFITLIFYFMGIGLFRKYQMKNSL
jgi:hypothetical protein